MDDIRSQILTTSSDLFLKYGVRSVTIDDVCTRLRISKKTFYIYFRQKEELIDSVLQLYCDTNIKENSKQHSFWDDPALNAIDKIVFSSRHWKEEHENEYFVFFYDLLKYYPEVHKKMMVRMDEEALRQIKKWTQEGINEGLLRSDVDLDLLAHYINMQFRSGLADLIGKLDVDVTKTIDFLLDCCLRVLVNEKGYRYYQEKYKNKYPPLARKVGRSFKSSSILAKK